LIWSECRVLEGSINKLPWVTHAWRLLDWIGLDWIGFDRAFPCFFQAVWFQEAATRTFAICCHDVKNIFGSMVKSEEHNGM
jgi:hypothetical protein